MFIISGLNEELLSMIGEDKQLQYLIKLHDTIQKVKSSNIENETAITALSDLFKNLGEDMQRVQKAQKKSANTAQDKKKEEQKKGKK